MERSFVVGSSNLFLAMNRLRSFPILVWRDGQWNRTIWDNCYQVHSFVSNAGKPPSGRCLDQGGVERPKQCCADADNRVNEANKTFKLFETAVDKRDLLEKEKQHAAYKLWGAWRTQRIFSNQITALMILNWGSAHKNSARPGPYTIYCATAIYDLSKGETWSLIKGDCRSAAKKRAVPLGEN